MSQFIKYILVGALNTAIGYLTYWIALQLGLFYAIAAVISQVIGSINSYLMNKFFTFRSKSKSKAEILRFAFVSMVQYFFNIGFITIFIRFFDLSDEVAGLCSIGLCTVIGFLGHKFISFKKTKDL